MDDNPFAALVPQQQADDNPFAGLVPKKAAPAASQGDDNPFAGLVPKKPTMSVAPTQPAPAPVTIRPAAAPAGGQPQVPIYDANDRPIQQRPDPALSAPGPGRSTLMDAPGQLAGRAVQAVQDIPAEIGSAFQGAQALSQEGVQDTAKGRYLVGPAKAVAGAAGELFSPLTGITQALVGKPVAELTGSEDIGNKAADVAGLLPVERLLPKGLGAGKLEAAPGRVEPTPEVPVEAQARKLGTAAVGRFVDRAVPAIEQEKQRAAEATQQRFREKVLPEVERAVIPDQPGRPVEPQPVSKPVFTNDSEGGDLLGLRKFRDSRSPDAPAWLGKTEKLVHELADRFGVQRPEVTSAEGGARSAKGVHYITVNRQRSSILLNRSLDEKGALAVALHEFGHHLDATLLHNAPLETQRAVNDAYQKYLRTLPEKPPQNWFKPVTSEGIDSNAYSADHLAYLRNRQEWFAEQTSRFITQTAEPRGVVERFFKAAADRWRQIYSYLTGNYAPLDKDVEAFLRGHWREPEGMFSRPGDYEPRELMQGPPTPVKPVEPDIERALQGTEVDPPSAQPRAAGAAPTPVVDLLHDLQLRHPEAPKEYAISKVPAALRAVFSPATVDIPARDAKEMIRSFGGTARRDSELTRAALEGFKKTVQGWDDEQRLEFISYLEGRSQQHPFADPKVQAIADSIRDQLADRRTQLEALPDGAKRQFIEDYYPHLWKDPAAVRAQMAKGMGTKEGSIGFTKARKLPTVAEGIRSGFIPLSLDPIETTLRYVENADRYLATERTFAEARRLGTVKYFKPGAIPEGWAAVNGRMQSRAGKVAAAPAGWANVYNKFISRGWENSPIYQALQQGSSLITGLELSLSGFHATTMGVEGGISSVANAIDRLKGGDVVGAGKALANAPLAFVTTPLKGRKVEQAYLGHTSATPDYARIANLLEKAGGRATGRGRIADEYRFSAYGSYWRAFKQGTLKSQLMDRTPMHPVLGPAREIIRAAQRAMETVTEPLFERYIPMMKNGAFYDGMSTWIAQHPQAGMDEQVRAAQQIWDSIDNRFGEVVHDNIFWDKTVKQSAQLAMLSYSWNLGTAREIGGGVADLARGRLSSPRASYVLAMPIAYAAMSAVYQKIKTGEAPQDLKDLIAPRTGGKDKYGEPERLALPGYAKDVFGFYLNGPVQELINKANPLARTAVELAKGKDWKGDRITPEDASTYEAVRDYLQHVGQAFTPFSINNAAMGGKKGTGITAGERFMGLHNAPFGVQDSAEADRFRKQRGAAERRKRMREDAAQRAGYKGTQ